MRKSTPPSSSKKKTDSRPELPKVDIPNYAPKSPSSIYDTMEAPVFRPTPEQFADPIAFIKMIQPLVEQTGICRIVPPQEVWDSEVFKRNVNPNTFSFSTKRQAVHQMVNRKGPNVIFTKKLKMFWKNVKKSPLKQTPEVESRPLDWYKLHLEVSKRGGIGMITDKGWEEVRAALRFSSSNNHVLVQLPRYYARYIQPYLEYEATQSPSTSSTTTPVTTPSKVSEKKFDFVDLTSNTDDEEDADATGRIVLKKYTMAKSVGSAQKSKQYSTSPDTSRNLRSTGPVSEPDSAAVETKRTTRSNKETVSVSKDFVVSPRKPQGSKKRKGQTLIVLSSDSESDTEDGSPIPRSANNKPSFMPRKAGRMMAMSPQSTETASTKRIMNAEHKMSPPNKKRHIVTWREVRMRSFMRDGDMDAADIICAVCGLGDRPNKLVVCENDCMNGCHIDCMSPPLASIPRRKWYCPRCDEESSSDDTAEEESYGYDEGKEYTLSQFARNANAFERQWFSDHYRGNVFYPPTARELETSYWDIVEKAEDKVHVYYGSDLDVGDHGSGFPADISRKCPENARWRRQLKEFPPLEQSSDYMIKSGWNLNNLAHVSVLQHLGQSVAGVTRPMLYVGMLFSSFCWHTEDNFMYSINYVHTGAAKRWYGIPGNAAEKFEEAMRQEVPELFEQQPNLLFLLVTQMSPKRLEKYGVPVYTTLQQEGEFVVTFPRSYHAGFNCGYNVAESVNFAAPDWLRWCRTAVDSYRNTRSSVFPLEEILTKVGKYLSTATNPDPDLCSIFYEQFKKRYEEDDAIIQQLLDGSAKMTHLDAEEAKSDDCKQCDICGYDCYMYGVKCKCRPGLVTCLADAHKLCECPASAKKIIFRFHASVIKKLLKSAEELMEAGPNRPNSKQTLKPYIPVSNRRRLSQ